MSAAPWGPEVPSEEAPRRCARCGTPTALFRAVRQKASLGNLYDYTCSNCGASFSLISRERLVGAFGSTATLLSTGTLLFHKGWFRFGVATLAFGVTCALRIPIELWQRARNPLAQGTGTALPIGRVLGRPSSIVWALLGAPFALSLGAVVAWLCVTLALFVLSIPATAIGGIVSALDEMHAPGVLPFMILVTAIVSRRELAESAHGDLVLVEAEVAHRRRVQRLSMRSNT